MIHFILKPNNKCIKLTFFVKLVHSLARLFLLHMLFYCPVSMSINCSFELLSPLNHNYVIYIIWKIFHVVVWGYNNIIRVCSLVWTSKTLSKVHVHALRKNIYTSALLNTRSLLNGRFFLFITETVAQLQITGLY